MRPGTTLALVLCLQIGAALGTHPSADEQKDERPGTAEPALEDTTGVEPSGVVATEEQRPVPARAAELGAYKSMWERMDLVPQVRRLSSGSMGGVEALGLRGRPFRRISTFTAGMPCGPDLNSLTPSLIDTVEILSLMRAQEEPLGDGGDVLCARSRKLGLEESTGLLFLGKGDFASSFNTFSFGRRAGPWSFGVDLAGRSFGRAASYEGYSSDLVDFTGGYLTSQGIDLAVRARKFRSDLRRYTSDRTKTLARELSVRAGRTGETGPAWQALAYYAGNDYTYKDNGPELEDDIATYGISLDVRPLGTDGGHRASIALRRDALERSYKNLLLPEGEVYQPPDDGRQQSNDLTGIYQAELASIGCVRVKGLARIDHKKLFGWTPSWTVGLVGSGCSFGDFRLEGGRTAFSPNLLEIYSPRDEAPRPTWFMADRMDPETGWEISGSLKWAVNRWSFSLGGYGALREHALAPSGGALGFVRGFSPVLVSPLEDLGDGSVGGLWGSCAWSPTREFAAGAWYSGQRARAGGEAVPFQAAHATALWVKGERKYFSNDLTLGVVLRGFYYSSQETPTHDVLPSYGVGEALGYAEIADVVFFYQIRNLETRQRPSPVLDLSSGKYLPQPGAEVRMGLVWYLPG
jgi:hypothetical protein